MGLFWNLEEFSGNRGNKKNRMRRDIRRKLGLETFLPETAFWRKKEKTREEENQEREKPPIIHSKVRVGLTFSNSKLYNFEDEFNMVVG